LMETMAVAAAARQLVLDHDDNVASVGVGMDENTTTTTNNNNNDDDHHHPPNEKVPTATIGDASDSPRTWNTTKMSGTQERIVSGQMMLDKENNQAETEQMEPVPVISSSEEDSAKSSKLCDSTTDGGGGGDSNESMATATTVDETVSVSVSAASTTASIQSLPVPPPQPARSEASWTASGRANSLSALPYRSRAIGMTSSSSSSPSSNNHHHHTTTIRRPSPLIVTQPNPSSEAVEQGSGLSSARPSSATAAATTPPRIAPWAIPIVTPEVELVAAAAAIQQATSPNSTTSSTTTADDPEIEALFRPSTKTVKIDRAASTPPALSPTRNSSSSTTAAAATRRKRTPTPVRRWNKHDDDDRMPNVDEEDEDEEDAWRANLKPFVAHLRPSSTVTLGSASLADPDDFSMPSIPSMTRRRHVSFSDELTIYPHPARKTYFDDSSESDNDDYDDAVHRGRGGFALHRHSQWYQKPEFLLGVGVLVTGGAALSYMARKLWLASRK